MSASKSHDVKNIGVLCGDVEVVENYGNSFIFQVDESISGIYAVNANTPGKTRHISCEYVVSDAGIVQKVLNEQDIEKGYIIYSYDPTISCQYAFDSNSDINLYFNYDNYLVPKFKTEEIQKHSYLHLNSVSSEGILQIVGEYQDKYEMPGAYYLITNISDTKPKFKIKKLTYAEKVQYFYDQTHTYETDDKIDYLEDDQYLKIDDETLNVTDDDFINNDNLDLAGGSPSPIVEGLVDPEDVPQDIKIDEVRYVYLDCAIQSSSGITGDIGITNQMQADVSAVLSWNSNHLSTLQKTLVGYTSYLSATGNTSFYPLYLDYGDVVLSNFWTIDEVGEAGERDLEVKDVTIMNKVINATTSIGEAKTYAVKANVDFSDQTQYIVKTITKKGLGELPKTYAIYIITKGNGTLTGTLNTLTEKIEKKIYIPVIPPDFDTGTGGGGGGGGGGGTVVVFEQKNAERTSMTKLFRMHDLKHMTLTTCAVFKGAQTPQITTWSDHYYLCKGTGKDAWAYGTGYGIVDLTNVIFGCTNDYYRLSYCIPISSNKSQIYGGILPRAYFLYQTNDPFPYDSGSESTEFCEINIQQFKAEGINQTQYFDLPTGTLSRITGLDEWKIKRFIDAGWYCSYIQTTDSDGYYESKCLAEEEAYVDATRKDQPIKIHSVDKQQRNIPNPKMTSYYTLSGKVNNKSGASVGKVEYENISDSNEQTVKKLKLTSSKILPYAQTYAICNLSYGKQAQNGYTAWSFSRDLSVYDFGYTCISITNTGFYLYQPSLIYQKDVAEIKAPQTTAFVDKLNKIIRVEFTGHTGAIEGVYITNGFFDYQNEKYAKLDIQTEYRRGPDTTINNILVVNVVIEANTATNQIVVQIPINALIPETYHTSPVLYIALDETLDILNSTEADCQSKTMTIVDGCHSSAMVSVQQALKLKNEIQGMPCGVEYKINVATAPVPDITYVCTNSLNEILSNTKNTITTEGSPLLFGTKNGIYRYNSEDGSITQVMEAGYVKKIFPLVINPLSKQVIYFAFVCDSAESSTGSLKQSKDYGKTWEEVDSSFSSRIKEVTWKANSAYLAFIDNKNFLRYGKIAWGEPKDTTTTATI